MQHFTLPLKWAIGDIVVISSLLRDLKLTYGDQYGITPLGHYKGIFWTNNPYVHEGIPANSKKVDLDYSNGIKASMRGYGKHFIKYIHDKFLEETGIYVPVLYPKGDIHLSTEEKNKKLVEGKYWVVLAGGKTDITTKIWNFNRYQKVVDELARRGIRTVQVGNTCRYCVNPELVNCINMVGKTRNERDFFSLLYNAEGIICGVTSAMHIAAVFDKPCVVIAGGREEVTWEAYRNDLNNFEEKTTPVAVEHCFLHTIGKLDCSTVHPQAGCWKTKTVALRGATVKSDSLCIKPKWEDGVPLPECLQLITPDMVVDSVLSYYEKGILSRESLKMYSLPMFEAPKVGSLESIMVTAPVSTLDSQYKIMDHPILGGKVTICVLGYGDYPHLLDGCLSSIIKSVPRERREIRVALNQPSLELEKVAERFYNLGEVSCILTDKGTRKKYPAMRDLFNVNRIETNYTVWFDDDTLVKDVNWLLDLSEVIIANHPQGARLYGWVMQHDLAIYNKRGHNPLEWFRQATWWRNKPLRNRLNLSNIPNGSLISFVAGWFWAIATDLIYSLNLPDYRVDHNGDPHIGAAVEQAGYSLKMFNQDKKYIWCPKKEKGGRRGYSEAFPWADPLTRQTHKVGS